MGIDGHGVALLVIPGPDGVPVIFAQCECGARASFPEVTTFTAVADYVNMHHGRVLRGVVK
jgi:hypothetical protein